MADAPPTPRTLPEAIEPVQAISRMPEGGSERDGFVPLDRNERVSPLPEWFMDRLRSELTSSLLVDYPATDLLHRDLSAQLGLDGDRVLLTPGADPVFRALMQVYVAPGDGVIALDPSYAMYAVYTAMFGGAFTGIPYDGDLQPDLDALHEALAPGVKLVLIANPNQPTGTVLADAELEAIARRAEEAGALLVVDEAYAFFTDGDARALLDVSPNVLLVRTWSKAGFAGARIGYVAGDPEVVGNLRKVRSAADVPSFAALCGRLLLEHPEVGEDYGREVREGAELLAERGRALGLEALPTHGNFLLLRLSDGLEPRTVVQACQERGWLIKGPFGTPGLKGCIRVTLGPAELMGRFADVLAEVLDDLR